MWCLRIDVFFSSEIYIVFRHHAIISFRDASYLDIRRCFATVFAASPSFSSTSHLFFATPAPLPDAGSATAEGWYSVFFAEELIIFSRYMLPRHDTPLYFVPWAFIPFHLLISSYYITPPAFFMSSHISFTFQFLYFHIFLHERVIVACNIASFHISLFISYFTSFILLLPFARLICFCFRCHSLRRLRCFFASICSFIIIVSPFFWCRHFCLLENTLRYYRRRSIDACRVFFFAAMPLRYFRSSEQIFPLFHRFRCRPPALPARHAVAERATSLRYATPPMFGYSSTLTLYHFLSISFRFLLHFQP